MRYWFIKPNIPFINVVGLSFCFLFVMVIPVQTEELPDGSSRDQKTSTGIPSALPADRLFMHNVKITDGKQWKPDKKNKYWKQRFFTHTFSSGSHSIAVYGDTINVAWYDTRRGSADVYFSQSMDGGSTFTASIRINDDQRGAIHYKPSLAVDSNGHIYIAWRDDRNGHADMYFTRSVDGGKSFSKNIKLNDDPGWAYQGNPSLAVGPDGLIGVAWNENRDKNDDVYFTLSHDGGVTFSKNQKANDDKGRSAQSHPTVAIGSNGLIVIAWQDFRNGESDIYMIRSADGGKTFSPNLKLNDNEGTPPQVSPSVTVSGKTVLVAWADYRNGNKHLAPPDSDKAEPAWWEQLRKGNADIYYTVSRDGGVSFSPNAKVNDDTGVAPQAFPSTAVDNQGRLFVAWEDYRNENGDIFFAQSSSDELHFGPNVKVNDDTGTAGQYHPSLASDSAGRTYVIWTDIRDTQRFASASEEDFDKNYKKKKVYMKTPEEVYFAVGKTDKVRLTKSKLP